MKQTNLIIIGVVVLLVVVGGFMVLSGKKGTSTPDSTTMQQGTNEQTGSPSSTSGAMINEQTPTGASGAAMEQSGTEKAFTVVGSNFSFDVKTMTVKKGDTVKVTFKNSDGFHDWNLDEFNAHTKKIQAGAEETVTFTADKTGTFEYYCSVGNHRKMGMVGKITVE